jgi:DNA-binding transcriptional regulator of glucitol operon
MAVTTRQPAGQPGARWALLLRPRWLAWHSFVWIATVGMLFLGDWQLHRAESGNELSWAYTFEWPLFAAFTVYFWIKSLRDELREDAAASAASESGAVAAASGAAAVTAAAADGDGTTTATAPAVTASAGASAGDAAAVHTVRSAPAGRRADTWDATSWDATSWDATGQQAGADVAGEPVDIARATPADGEAYLARLRAEVQRSGRRHAAR